MNKIIRAISCAFRGRYKVDGSTEQHLEIHNEFANSLTTVQKDSMVVIEIEEESNN